MTNKIKRKRFSKEKWLDAALEILASQGVDQLTINNLSRTVGVAKTSFYAYFQDRQDLLNHMLNYWVLNYSLVITEKPHRQPLEPAERLMAIIDNVMQNKLLKYDLAIVAWANHDKSVRCRLEGVYSQLEEMIRRVFADAGFDEEQQKVRAQAFLCYFTWGGVMQGEAHSHKTMVERLVPIALTQ